MLHLTIIRPGGQVLEQGFVGDRIVVGRDENCDLRLLDSMVSRNHCLIFKEGQSCLVKDLESQNGTWINGRRVTSRGSVERGDAIQVGPFKLLVQGAPPAKGSGFRHFPAAHAKGPLHYSHRDTTEDVVKPLAIVTDYLSDGTGKLRPDSTGGRRERLNRNLLALYRIAEDLVVTRDLEEIMDHIMDRIFEILAPSQATILLTGKDGHPIPKRQRNAEGKGNPRAISKTVINRILTERVGVLTDNALEDPRFESGASVIIDGIRSIVAAPIWEEKKILGVIYVDSLDTTGGYSSEDLDLLTAIGHQTALAIQRWHLTRRLSEEAVKNALIRENLGRFHSPEVVDLILTGAADVKPRDVEATIFFCDIANFTVVSESGAPDRLHKMLNKFCKTVSEIVFEEKGTLDKFIGDAALAFYGAPLPQEDAAARAVRSALRIREQLSRHMQTLPPALRFRVRYGINTGRVVVGNFGSDERMDYTILGHAVNLASRICKTADPDKILIGPETFQQIRDKDEFKVRKVGARRLKGLTGKMELFEIEDFVL